MINKIKNNSNRNGIALLVMLFIVATVAVLSFGFVMKADAELSCGENTILRAEMDYIGLTALNYTKSMLLNPQDITTGADFYWEGESDLQLVEGSDDYFDVQVVQSTVGDTPECTYDITCQGYKLDGVEKISETKLQAQLRLDPFIAFYSRDSTQIHSNVTIYGDVYCGNLLTKYGQIKGDLFTTSYWLNTNDITGQIYSRSKANVSWPNINYWRFEPSYYIDTDKYWPVTINGTYSNVSWSTSAGNPAGIYYRNGNLDLKGNVKINGTLVVNGNLDIETDVFEITAVKNYPAIIVEGRLRVHENGSLKATGLIQTQTMEVKDTALDVNITGGLYIYQSGLLVDSTYTGKIVVKGDPMKSTIKLMSTDVNMMEWSPVGGAYYKYIRRY